ncbi:MAG: hypothetical protein ACE365_06035 [Gammaproteobacteria bacterium]
MMFSLYSQKMTASFDGAEGTLSAQRNRVGGHLRSITFTFTPAPAPDGEEKTTQAQTISLPISLSENDSNQPLGFYITQEKQPAYLYCGYSEVGRLAMLLVELNPNAQDPRLRFQEVSAGQGRSFSFSNSTPPLQENFLADKDKQPLIKPNRKYQSTFRPSPEPFLAHISLHV